MTVGLVIGLRQGRDPSLACAFGPRGIWRVGVRDDHDAEPFQYQNANDSVGRAWPDVEPRIRPSARRSGGLRAEARPGPVQRWRPQPRRKEPDGQKKIRTPPLVRRQEGAVDESDG